MGKAPETARAAALPSAGGRAVVLSGGGADGAYGVGIMKALFSGRSPATRGEPLEPEIFTGTSIGSFNAAFLVSQWAGYGAGSIGNLERLWLDRLARQRPGAPNGAYRLKGNPADLLRPRTYRPNPIDPLARFFREGTSLGWEAVRRVAHFLEAEEDLPQRVAELFNFSSFVSREPWSRTIRDAIDFDAVRRSDRALRVAATNWTTGRLTIFTNQQMNSSLGPLAIEASSAIPGFYRPAQVGAQPYVDGGVLLNTPLLPAIRAGAGCLYVVFLDPAITSIPLAHLENTLETLYRTQQIAWASTIKADVAAARRINETLDMIATAEARGEADDPFFGRLRRRYARFRPLTIHRFVPQEDFGGALGLLNLDRRRIERLIRRGFEDATEHDCEAAGCVIADRGHGTETDDDHDRLHAAG